MESNFATSPSSVEQTSATVRHITTHINETATAPSHPLWFLYLAYALALPMSGHPQLWAMGLGELLASLSVISSDLQRRCFTATEYLNDPEDSVWYSYQLSGPCGTVHFHMSSQAPGIAHFYATANRYFHSNVTVLGQEGLPSSHVQIHWSPPSEVVAGTSGKYSHFLNSNIFMVEINSILAPDNVFLVFEYQIYDQGCVISNLAASEITVLGNGLAINFASLHVRAWNAVHKMYIWTMTFSNVYSFVFAPVLDVYATCERKRTGDTWIRVWEGEELVMPGASGFISGLTELISRKLCNISDLEWDTKHLFPETARGFQVQGTIGAITVGVDYRVSTFLDLIINFGRRILGSQEIHYKHMVTMLDSHINPDIKVNFVSSNITYMFYHTFYSAEGGLFPVLTVKHLEFVRRLNFRTSGCKLAAVSLFHVYFREDPVTLCSAVQISMLKKVGLSGLRGVYFSDGMGVLVVRTYGRVAHIHIQYTVELSRCRGLINPCDFLVMQLPGPAPRLVLGGVVVTWFLEYPDIYRVTRNSEECLIIQVIPSDLLGRSRRPCTLQLLTHPTLIKAKLVVRTVTGKSFHFLPISACTPAIVLRQNAWKEFARYVISNFRPSETYEQIDMWHEIQITQPCPPIGKFYQLTLKDAEHMCNVTYTSALAPQNEMPLTCGVAEFTQLANGPLYHWIFFFRRSGIEDFMLSCCWLVVEILFIPDGIGIIFQVDFRENYMANNSNFESYPATYRKYPSKDRVSFTFSFQGTPNNPVLTISRLPKQLTAVSHAIRVVVRYQSRRIRSSLFQIPMLTFGHFHAISRENSNKSWWHACQGSRCYWYGNSPNLSWTEAENICQAKGGHLFTPNNKDEVRTIQYWATTGIIDNLKQFEHSHKSRLELMRQRAIYIGLFFDDKEGGWAWIDRSPVLHSDCLSERDTTDSPQLLDYSKQVANDIPFKISVNGSRGLSNVTHRCTAMLIFGAQDMPWEEVPCDFHTQVGYLCEKSVINFRALEELSPVLVTGLYDNGTRSLAERHDKRPVLYSINETCHETWLLVDHRCILITSTHQWSLGDSFSLPSTAESVPTEAVYSSRRLQALFAIALSHLDSPKQSQLVSGLNGTDTCSGWFIAQDKIGTTDRMVTQKFSSKGLCFRNNSYGVYSLSPTGHLFGCLPGQYTCNDKSCILNIYRCDGHIHCADSSDEHHCPTICYNRSNTHFPFEDAYAINRWCSKECAAPHCICNDPFFQCQMGGCITFSYVCDHTNQCKDGSDEELCIPNEPENFTLNPASPEVYEGMSPKQLGFKSQPNEFQCSQEIHSKLPFNSLCLFERKPDGRVQYCERGEHLEMCSQFQCPGRYKCSFSYCIHLYMVCNGVIDCPDADDEVNCPPLECTNLFRCSLENTCIDLAHIQDGRIHCLKSLEDELGFHTVRCPPKCRCIGYVLYCPSQGLNDIPKYNVRLKALLLRNNHLVAVRSINTLNMYRDLVKIDLANNRITTVTKQSFSGVRKLLFLDLSGNNIAKLQGRSFHSLKSLAFLDLHHTPLQSLEQTSLTGLKMSLLYLNLTKSQLRNVPKCVFRELTYLEVLDLSHNNLHQLDENLFCGLPSLKYLDLRGNKLTEIKGAVFSARLEIDIRLDQMTVCCLVKDMKICKEEQTTSRDICSDIIPDMGIRIAVWSASFCILSTTNISLAFLWWSIMGQYRQESNPFNVFQISQTIFDFLFGVYLMTTGSEDIALRGTFAIKKEQWYISGHCMALRILSTVYVNSWIALSTVKAIYRYFATVHPLKSMKIKSNFNMAYSSFGAIVFSNILLLLIIAAFDEPDFQDICFMISGNSAIAFVSYILFLSFSTIAVSVIISLQSHAALILFKSSPEWLGSSKSRGKSKHQGVLRLCLLSCMLAVIWVIFCGMEIARLAGYNPEISIKLWVIASIHPVNILCNALITTFSTTRFKQFVGNVVKNCSVHKSQI